MRIELGIKMNKMITISGISRQGYYKAVHKARHDNILLQRLKEVVIEVRKDYPRISARKIH